MRQNNDPDPEVEEVRREAGAVILASLTGMKDAERLGPFDSAATMADTPPDPDARLAEIRAELNQLERQEKARELRAQADEIEAGADE